MNNLNTFYNSILNINNKDYEEKIKKIVLEEKRDLIARGLELDGFCKYLANQIECRIKEELSGVHVYRLDLNDFNLVDHTILIVEYMTNKELKRLLIDPSFTQFIKKDNANLIKLDKWPGNHLDDFTLSSLEKIGLVEINNISFNNYLNSFTNESIDFNLDDYLLENKIGKKI